MGESALAGHLDRVDRLAALNILCIAYVSRETPVLAMPHCNRLVRVSHGDWRCLNNRGIAWLGLGDVPTAIQDFELALSGLRASGDATFVRHHGTGRVRPGLETLTGNLDLARRRYSAGLLLAKDGPVTRP
jgi:hypothetical protein